MIVVGHAVALAKLPVVVLASQVVWETAFNRVYIRVMPYVMKLAKVIVLILASFLLIL